MPLNLTLALRNLFHDRLRFVATTIGIVFSVVLVMVQMGLYLGFGRMVTTVIDHTSADLWVMRHGTKCFEDPSLLSHSKQTGAAATAGVAEVTPLVIGFSGWILPSGEITPVFVVGSDLQILKPWNLTEGTVRALSGSGTVAVDRSYFERLGVSGIGSKANIRGLPVSVAAVSEGIRSFTTTPYVFSDLSQARAYIGIPSTMVSYLLVKLRPGADLEHVRHDLQTCSSSCARARTSSTSATIFRPACPTRRFSRPQNLTSAAAHTGFWGPGRVPRFSQAQFSGSSSAW